MLANGAYIVIGEVFTLVNVVTDGATPAGLCRGLACARLDGGLIVSVGAVLCFAQHLGVYKLTDEKGVATQIVGFHNIQGKERGCILCEIVKTVFTSGNVGKVSKLIYVSARLHTKVLEERKRRVGAERRQIALACCKDHIVGQVALDSRDGNSGGVICHLHCGVDNAGIILAVMLRGHKIYAVCKIIKSFSIHSIPLILWNFDLVAISPQQAPRG